MKAIKNNARIIWDGAVSTVPIQITTTTIFVLILNI
jgi:hypothetical protein